MLRVTVDIFSGRPNPTWIVTDEKVTARVIAAVSRDRGLMSRPDVSGLQGLGLRGIEIQIMSDDEEATAAKLPTTFVLAIGRGPSVKRSVNLATGLVKEMTRWSDIALPEHALTPINKAMRDGVLEELERAARALPIPRVKPTPRPNARRRTIPDTKCDRCQYEVSIFNPGFWNNDPGVCWNNNCYNYARDWRTDTFAQPGRASGHPTSTMSCPAVSAAARSDGLVDRCKCLPASEFPRRLMALVIKPGPAGDYHWYRHQIGGFWGHKPGHTQARNFDNGGVVIANPETCNRGPYTNFCGYFYAGKSVHIA